MNHHLVWLPSLPPYILISMAFLSVILGIYGLWKRARGLIWRALAVLLVVLWLAHPQYLRPTWQPQPQDALLIVDHSPSTAINGRQKMLDHAADTLEEEARHIPTLHLHRLDVTGENGQGTRLFETLEQEAPAYSHLAGVFLLTDGMNHDTPAHLPKILHDGHGHPLPIHLLISATHEEVDRRLRILSAPPYVIVGHTAHVRVQVDDMGLPPGQAVTIMERQSDGSATLVANTTTGTPVDLDIPITQPGLTLKEFYASPLEGEASLQNNSVVLQLKGLRDRLKVLLVSGVPNQAARVWRQLLKADPSVDLVHFTILRSPETDDDTPLSDLALIPFPTHELFEQKIRSFDLIILDSFRNQNILPEAYLQNIANYVRKGGGLLVVSGPEITQEGSLQQTALGDILPAHIPPGGIRLQRFLPHLTKLGLRHPVTANLAEPPFSDPHKPWGAWYRALIADHVQGQNLLDTDDGHPLLLLNQIEQGRVAMLLSDQIWLWSRGTQNAGPQAELLRRLAHWLMQEPDLEENRLEARIENHQLIVNRHSNTTQSGSYATVITPSHEKISLLLSSTDRHGVLHATLPLSETTEHEAGIWTVKQDNLTAFTSPPILNPLEDSDLRSTAQILQPLVNESGGGLFWLGKEPAPHLRQINTKDITYGRTYGKDWAGLPLQRTPVPGKDHFIPLLPGWMALISVLFLLALGWRQEGR